MARTMAIVSLMFRVLGHLALLEFGRTTIEKHAAIRTRHWALFAGYEVASASRALAFFAGKRHQTYLKDENTFIHTIGCRRFSDAESWAKRASR